jgi:serine/threonine protein kinase
MCAGGALDDILEDRGCVGLSEAQVQAVAAQATPALAFLHGRGVYHRDVKPGNLLLTSDGVVKLTDFATCSLNNVDFQKHNTFIGSPFWMAPEVIECDVPGSTSLYDHRADSWGLGVRCVQCTLHSLGQ